MTREEQIKVLKDWKPELELMAKYNSNSIDYQRYTALDMAIKALEQQPCEDAIRRADAEALFRNARSKLNPSDYKTADEFNTRDLMLLNAEQFIHLLPSVRPQEPKTGHWEMCEDADGIYGVCDICGTDADFTHYGKAYPYCPNCGAKMESEDKE